MAGEAGSVTTQGALQALEPRHLAAWTALANLFLDTEYSDSIRNSLARDLRETGYSITELERMLQHEIAPVFGGNLLSIAGEWVLWEKDEVDEIMARELSGRKRPRLSRRIVGTIALPLAKSEWRQIARLVEAGRV